MVTFEEQEALKKFWLDNEEIVQSRMKSKQFYKYDITSYQKLLNKNLQLFIDLTEEIAIKNTPDGKLKTYTGKTVNETTDVVNESFIKAGTLSVRDLEAKADELYEKVKYDLKNKKLIT